MLPRLIGIVKWNLSGAKRRRDGRGEDGGAGQGAAAPCPRLSTQNPGARTALRPRGDAFLLSTISSTGTASMAMSVRPYFDRNYFKACFGFLLHGRSLPRRF